MATSYPRLIQNHLIPRSHLMEGFDSTSSLSPVDPLLQNYLSAFLLFALKYFGSPISELQIVI